MDREECIEEFDRESCDLLDDPEGSFDRFVWSDDQIISRGLRDQSFDVDNIRRMNIEQGIRDCLEIETVDDQSVICQRWRDSSTDRVADLREMKEDVLAARSTDLTKKDSDEFESYVAEIWSEMGWETETTDKNDRGVDVYAQTDWPYDREIVIQVKRYASGNRISSTQVQKYALLDRQEGVDDVVIVTSSDFSQPAEEVAEDLNVKLIDGHDLCQISEEIIDENPCESE